MPISKIRLPSKPPADYEVPHGGGEGGRFGGEGGRFDDLPGYITCILGCVFLGDFLRIVPWDSTPSNGPFGRFFFIFSLYFV